MSDDIEARLLALTLLEAFKAGRMDDAVALGQASSTREIIIGLVQIADGFCSQLAAENGTTSADIISIYRHGLWATVTHD